MNIEFVLDCSATLTWFFKDEMNVKADRLQEQLEQNDIRAWVPSLWHLEICNTLVVAERQRRISAMDAEKFIADLETYNITADDETTRHAWRDTRALAQQHHLSAYDAAYLELALRRRLPLATLDKPLAVAAKKSGVKLLL